MSVLSAQSIRQLCTPEGRTVANSPTKDLEWWLSGRVMIDPFAERTAHRGKTYGLGPAGFDVRVAGDVWLLPVWGRLTSTIERFDLPRDVTFLVQDKSSWARRFVFAMNTNAEPGWRGWLTLELVRFLPWPIRVWATSPIANIMFLTLDKCTDQPYPPDGKYQDQEAGPQPARESATHTDTILLRPVVAEAITCDIPSEGGTVPSWRLAGHPDAGERWGFGTELPLYEQQQALGRLTAEEVSRHSITAETLSAYQRYQPILPSEVMARLATHRIDGLTFYQRVNGARSQGGLDRDWAARTQNDYTDAIEQELVSERRIVRACHGGVS